ncbi:MAG TPA: flagellar basal body-associated FliL family protein [Kineosporiaceae bacterium]
MAKKNGADDTEGGRGGFGVTVKVLVMVLPTVLLIIGAVYVFVLGGGNGRSGPSPSGSADVKAGEDTTHYSPGQIVTVDPVTINLANGHFLKVGLALQATADAGGAVTGSKAQDALIAEFSGRTVEEIATKGGRDAAKRDLVQAIKKAYAKKVYDIYWTTFVMN